MTTATHIGNAGIGTVSGKLVRLIEATGGRNAVARVVHRDGRVEAMPISVFHAMFRGLTESEIARVARESA